MLRKLLSIKSKHIDDIDHIFSQLNNPIILLGATGEILKCNKAALDLYQLESTQILNQDYFTVFPLHHIKPAFSSMQEILDDSSKITLTTINDHLNQERTIQWTATVIKNNSSIKHIYLQGLNITPYISYDSILEKQLKNSIIDHMKNQYIFWKDTHGIYLGCNEAFAHALGFKTPSEVVGKTDYDFFVKKEESDAYLADDRYVMESKTPKLNIEEPQTLDGVQTKIVLTSKVPLLNEENQVYGVLGIYTDITEQKSNELKIFEMNKKLEQAYRLKSDREKKLQESIIDHLPSHFIFWKDKNSVFLGCNQAFASGANISSPDEIIGKTDYDLPWSKEESDAYRADDCRVMESKQPKLNIEETQTLPDGRQIILSTSKVPLFDEEGNVYGVLAVYSDITEQKSTENKLIEMNQKLEKASQVKSEFIRNISHDIRTPLSGIQQTLQAFSEGKIPKEQMPEYAFAAWAASNKLMELFNQIIDTSKNEHFDFQDKIVKFDLHKLLQDLKETYMVVAKHKGLALEIEYSVQVPHYLLGKHLRLHRILMNLIGNALKFTEKGSVKLIIEQSQKTDEKVLLRFSVIDTGMGISKDKQEIIFEPFSRLTPSFQGQYPGSGLGLHVVKEYVEKMQGEIYVESEWGKGSMFTCILPFKQSILDNDNDVIEADYRQTISKDEITYFHKKDTNNTVEFNSKIITNDPTAIRILLVEDDPLSQNMCALILKNIGYQVDIAKSGEQALDLTTKNYYKIIYMDVGLPGIDGIEATKCIRNNENNLNRKTFIAALTAHADEEITKQCLAAGMQQVLSKPLSTKKVQQIHVIISDLQDLKSQKTIIDFDLWRSRLGDNAQMIDELFHMLANDFGNNKLEIMNAYESQDLPKLKAVTHKLKGGLKYCGLPRLEAAIIAIETAAKNNDYKEVDKCYQETLDALDESSQAYEKWVHNNTI